MSALLDSLVLIAALAPDEARHAESLALLRQGGHAVYAHAILETFSTLTGGRLGVKVDADLAAKLLHETILPRVHVVEIGSAELMAALDQAWRGGLRLHAHGGRPESRCGHPLHDQFQRLPAPEPRGRS